MKRWDSIWGMSYGKRSEGAMKSGILVSIIGIMTITLLAGCSGEGDDSTLSRIVGELTVAGSPLPADGHSMAEVRVLVYEVSPEGRHPMEGIDVVLVSSRNQDLEKVDFIEQPVAPTFADGDAVAYIGSSEPGESALSATHDGVPLCEIWDLDGCVQNANAFVTFSP